MTKLAVLQSIIDAIKKQKFKLLQSLRMLNCGVGMILIVDENSADEIFKHLQNNGETFYKIGRVVEGVGVKIRGDFFND